MGAVISEASKTSVEDFASDFLFKPLGIKDHFRWAKNRMTGRTFTAGNLRISPRNMLTLGNMVINKGKYQGKQIISEKTIAAILDEKVTLPFDYSFFKTAGNRWEGQKAATYGYYWYTEKAKINNRTLTLKFTFGNGGNYIVLIPELNNLVIVFTGSNYGRPILNKQPFDMMYQYILPYFINKT
jgi:CubicO group peptidase (beta-lactamase class C family)